METLKQTMSLENLPEDQGELGPIKKQEPPKEQAVKKQPATFRKTRNYPKQELEA